MPRQAPPSTDDPFLSPTQAADLLHVDEVTIRTLVRTGRLRHLRVGRQIRILRSWLLECLAQQEPGTTMPPRPRRRRGFRLP